MEIFVKKNKLCIRAGKTINIGGADPILILAIFGRLKALPGKILVYEGRDKRAIFFSSTRRKERITIGIRIKNKR